MSSIFSGSYTLSASTSTGVPKLWNEGFNGYNSFRVVCSIVFLSLHNVWLWVSIFASVCGKRNRLWWWLSKVLICEYNRISTGVLLLLIFLLSDIWLYPTFLGYLYLVSGSWSCKQYQVWIPYCRVGLKSKEMLPGYFKFCITTTLAYHEGRSKVLWFGIYISLLVLTEYLPAPKALEYKGEGSM